MRTVLRFKWLVLVLWLAVAAGLMLSAPNMEDLVRDKGQISVPDGYSSSEASKLLSSLEGQDGEGKTDSTVVVFHREGGLTDEDLSQAQQALQKLTDNGEQYGVTQVTTHFQTKELESQLVSKDKATVIALVKVKEEGRLPKEMSDSLNEALSDVKVDHYLTGGWVIGEDVVQSSQEGLKKTELITVGFILVILFLVFRSAIAPLVPLLAVGFSYLTSQSVVAYLVKYMDFPLSNFTQIFMVAVLFGIGTDYCILLISRYKEELIRLGDRDEAIVETYRTAGRTVLFSGLAVFVGFASIGFSTFVLYRSAVAVAVGVAVMLIALFTLVPFFLSVFGNALFWPARGSLEHKESKLWGAVGSFSLKRPLWALVILLVLIVPALTAYKGSISFNSLDEIGEKYDSVKAFNLVADGFGPGETLPTTVVVQSDTPMGDTNGLAVVEQVSRALAQVPGVGTVRSATRPTGEAPEDFLVSDQVGTLQDGLGKSGEGLTTIGDGLSDASKQLSDNAPKLKEAADGAGKLTDGTLALKAGINELSAGLTRIQQGMKDGSTGAKDLQAGLEQVRQNAQKLADAANQLESSYSQLGDGVTQLSTGYIGIASEQAKLASGLADVDSDLSGLTDQYPELANDAAYQKALGAVRKLQTDADQLSTQTKQLNGQLAGLSQGLDAANAGLKQAADGQQALVQGLQSLITGIAKLQVGLDQAAQGQGAVISKLPEMQTGLDQLANGQKQLASGFSELNGQLTQLTDGLDQSVDGLKQVTDGLGSAEGYLTELSSSPNKGLTGWFIPEQASQNEQFEQAVDVYMSPDRRTVKFDVIFDGNPYELETMNQIDALKSAVARGLQGTSFESAHYEVGGVTSYNHDLNGISDEDYSKTVMFMLIGIGIVLILLFRSIVMPLYLIASLMVTFYTAMAVTEIIFVRWLGYTGVSWAVPFFGFVMLVALGIDYSIFLMDRFKEYRHLPPTEAILEAMKRMGTVIMSAAVILGGTFAAMLPSGVMSLLQIATIVLCGLFMYALIMLPLFIPVMVRMFGEANYWPFMRRSDADAGHSNLPGTSVEGRQGPRQGSHGTGRAQDSTV
ncbi:RND superfamily putative drug exporter [Paenibacillus cellulosilyticus]|uniref:RND superfamily putative drug exporter n=1 Tax=Paenibacillus cellulosilyticus TaxID=375489 RepID=A0A2V2Z0C4_9BACL|nr:MMPL family transporter [Paenibacillus cellulosilyticus]PWW08297.1 RND superfamily putative drug exporter [Paenibacillus cellulosilyticus]QKS47897.1 MMPL family transporter [Paenibacillus cellulosilyticus]